jgi:hypothetical protein
VENSKFVSTRGKQEVASLTSAERVNLITLFACLNATSTYVPSLNTLDRSSYDVLKTTNTADED